MTVAGPTQDLHWRPVFGTGLARSGGGLYSGLLSVHAEIEVALCPHLELFRSFRDAVIRAAADPAVREVTPPGAPMQDHYFLDGRIAALDAVQAATLDLPFEPAEWEPFLARSIARATLETADLTPRYPDLRGQTYRAVFDNALRIVGETRRSPAATWVGWHEPWTIDFFPALARAYPEARFVVMLRDIRATVNSVRGVGERIPEQFVQSLSYARHWRKQVALALRYLDDPLFAGRILVTSHDDLVTSPTAAAQELCGFLGVDFDPAMLDTERYVDQSTGAKWGGNSSFEEQTKGIKAERATRWRERLDPAALESLEWLCGAELELGGWELVGPHETYPGPAAVQLMLDELAGFTNWRSDLGRSQEDLGFELLRGGLLELHDPCSDDNLVRRCFLFRETYDALREGRQRLRLR